MKYSKKFNRDWEFYTTNSYFDKAFSGQNLKVIALDTTGKTAKECYHILDSTGVESPCKEPYLLAKVLDNKAAINFQIKQWAEGIVEGVFFTFELLEVIEEYSLPDWVHKAVNNQAAKLSREFFANKFDKDKEYDVCTAEFITAHALEQMRET